MDENKIKHKEVWDANILYLIAGIVILIAIIALEALCVYIFIDSDDMSFAFTVSILFQILVLILYPGISLINDYRHRSKFNIYYCKLENDLDINYIKENFYIKEINLSYVYFIKKEDDSKFQTWKFMADYKDDINYLFNLEGE